MRNVDHLIKMHEDNTLPEYLCDAWESQYGYNPSDTLKTLKPDNWFWRNKDDIGINILIGAVMVMCFFPFMALFLPFEMASKLLDYALMAFFPIAAVMLAGASIANMRSPRRKAIVKLEPFADAVVNLLRLTKLTASEAKEYPMARMLSAIKGELVGRCTLILMFQKEYCDQPPTDASDYMRQDLQRELAEVFDTAKRFGFVDSDGYGRYYDIAKERLTAS